MRSFDLKYVVKDTDRHGNDRYYFRRKGQTKIRLPAPGSPEFLAAYQRALAGVGARKPAPRTPVSAGTFDALCRDYFTSAAYKSLEPRTQLIRRRILERFCEKLTPKGQQRHGGQPFREITAAHIRKLRDELSEKPEAANSLVKALRQLFSYAVEYELCDRNPASDVPYLAGNPDGFHSWSLDEIRQFEDKHPVGSMARLALALALYTGQRRSDLVTLGRQHVRNGSIELTQHKNRKRSPVKLVIPMLPELRRIIDATPCGDLTFLVTAFGVPFTSNGFGNRFRKWCDEAGLPHCSVHGLRKATAARLAELGCSELEIMAVTGHRTSKEVIRYTRAASQSVRAANAMSVLSVGRFEREVSHSDGNPQEWDTESQSNP